MFKRIIPFWGVFHQALILSGRARGDYAVNLTTVRLMDLTFRRSDYGLLRAVFPRRSFLVVF